MQNSPLTHQPRPEVFQQKIVRLYEALFKDDIDDLGDEHDRPEKSEGFWAEFFLLRPDRTALRVMLDGCSADELLQLEGQTRELFARAVRAMKTGREDGVAIGYALDTLSAFFLAILGKKYMNPSSDVIAVLAGLDLIDSIFTDFVVALDMIMRNGKSLEIRQKAVQVSLAVTSGAYQTSLLTYFIQRDLFPAIMKDAWNHWLTRPAHQLIQDTETLSDVSAPFILTGLLANYNKFEFKNPYQMRLNDFVNEAAIQKIIRGIGYTCQKLRADYVNVQDDVPEGWTLASTLSMIGLGIIARGGKPAPKMTYNGETAKMFAQLPRNEAAILLATYDFTHANKLFCFNFVTLPAIKGEEQPFAIFVSLTSYLFQHAHLSKRATLYSHLNLMVFRLLIEDPVLCKRMCSEESKSAVRLCRQRQPYLPLECGERVMITAVMDAMIDGLNHNLRRRLDVGLFTLCLGILLRAVSYLSRSRTRLNHHWSELFRSLLSLVRFLVTYAADLRDLPHVDTLLDHAVNLLALALSAGETFLPTPAAYDDLFYKVVESGELLVRFRDTYKLGTRAGAGSSIETLVQVSTHYKEMLADNGGPAKEGMRKKTGPTLTSLRVAEVIKQGYETLSIQAKEGLDSWDKYREVDERIVLKKMARAAVGDVRTWVAEG